METTIKIGGVSFYAAIQEDDTCVLEAPSPFDGLLHGRQETLEAALDEVRKRAQCFLDEESALPGLARRTTVKALGEEKYGDLLALCRRIAR